jgi:hypothetical protein
MSPPNERGRPCGAASETTRAAAVNDEHTGSLVEAAIIATAAAGCLCAPHAYLTNVTCLNGIRHVVVEHDGWCPLLGGDA